MEKLEIAKIGKPFGLKGEVHAFSLTSFPKLRFKKGNKYLLESQKTGESRTVTLTRCSINGDALILGFEESKTPEDAATLKDAMLIMDKADAPMPEGYVRYGDLLGMTCTDDDGNKLGTLIEVCEFSTTPSFRIKKADGGVFYVPFIDAFVGKIDYEAKTILIHVVEGML